MKYIKFGAAIFRKYFGYKALTKKNARIFKVVYEQDNCECKFSAVSQAIFKTVKLIFI